MKTKDIFLVAKYVWNNYPNIKLKCEFWQLLSLLDRNQEKIVFVRDNERFIGAAFYLKLSDENFLKVLSKKHDLTNPQNLKDLLNDGGNNIHFLYVVAENMKTVLKGIRKMIHHENPESVSWFKPSMDRVHIAYQKRSKICLQ